MKKGKEVVEDRRDGRHNTFNAHESYVRGPKLCPVSFEMPRYIAFERSYSKERWMKVKWSRVDHELSM